MRIPRIAGLGIVPGGMLVSLVLPLVLSLPGCGDTTEDTLSNVNTQPKISALMKATAPGANIDTVRMTITQVQLFGTGAPVAVVATSDPSVIYIVNAPTAGIESAIGVDHDRIPADIYASMRITFSSVILQFNDGSPDSEILSGAVDVDLPTTFTLAESQSATIHMSFNTQSSIVSDNAGGYDFVPSINVDSISFP